ncbi:hypothetical protein G6F63_016699 [Rhizopus arrhizus]|nr:hypothetical protein G6F63_016699 [Rhizopus arrhizus]
MAPPISSARAVARMAASPASQAALDQRGDRWRAVSVARSCPVASARRDTRIWKPRARNAEVMTTISNP